MIRRVHHWCLVAGLLIVAGCQTSPPRANNMGNGGSDSTLVQGYGLLYSTLKDESQLDKALILKNPGDEVKGLVKAIADFAGEAARRLDTMAREDTTLDLSNDGLPALETAARKSISSSTGKQILLSGGEEFAFNILLTQHEALKYIAALAKELAEQETDDARKRFLIRVAEDAGNLHELVIDQLKRPYVEAAKRDGASS